MEYYGFRFMSAEEQVLRNLLRGIVPWHVDPEELEKDYALQWAMDMEEDLEDLKHLRNGEAVRSERRVANYRNTVKLAFEFAYRCSCDVIVTDDLGEFSMVVLHTEALLFTKEKKREETELFSKLLTAADELYFAPSEAGPDEQRLNMQFIFDLCDTVKTE